MHRTIQTSIFTLVLMCFACSVPAAAKPSGGGHSSSYHSSSSHSSSPKGHSASPSARSSSSKSHPSHPRSTKAQGVPRNSKGRIARDSKQKAQFEKTHPCPSTGRKSGACPGYVVDHIRPLKRGGADRPENMQWQTKEAAKRKDRTE